MPLLVLLLLWCLRLLLLLLCHKPLLFLVLLAPACYAAAVCCCGCLCDLRICIVENVASGSATTPPEQAYVRPGKEARRQILLSHAMAQAAKEAQAQAGTEVTHWVL